MPTIQHQALTEPDAIHPATYVGTTDPATTYPSQIAAHQLWIDTSSSTFKIKKRNAGNTDWDIVASLTHTDFTGMTTGDPHTQYPTKAMLTTKGDLYVATAAGTLVRLGTGGAVSDGMVLTADDAATEGVAWTPISLITGVPVIQDDGTDMAAEPNTNFIGFTVSDNSGVATNIEAKLSTLTDTNVGTPTNGQVLTWDSTPGEWVAQAPSAGTLALDDITDVDLTTTPPADGDLLQWDAGASQWVPWGGLLVIGATTNQRRAGIVFQLGDGTNVITTSEREQWAECNFDGTIEGVTLLADVSGSIVVDVWKDTYANYPPVVGDSICASAKPTLSGADKSQDLTLTGWTTAITRGDIIKIHVDSAATVKAVTLALRVIKT